MLKRSALVAIILPASMAASAEESWKSQVELGYVSTTGNTETSTINAKFDAVDDTTDWRHTLHAESLNSSSGNVTSNERYQASAQSDYKFNETDYLYGLADAEKDRFSGYDYQAKLTAGYGRRIMSEPDMTLDLEIGPGMRFYKDTPTQTSESEWLLHLAARYHWKISESSSFSEQLTTDIGEDLTVTKSVTSLDAKINSSLALAVTFTIEDTSDVPAGNEETDTETAVTLVYSF